MHWSSQVIDGHEREMKNGHNQMSSNGPFHWGRHKESVDCTIHNVIGEGGGAFSVLRLETDASW